MAERVLTPEERDSACLLAGGLAAVASILETNGNRHHAHIVAKSARLLADFGGATADQWLEQIIKRTRGRRWHRSSRSG